MAGAPETVTLRAGRASAELAPSAGGRLMRWSIGGRPVLYWPEDADWSAPAKIRGGNPLLFPFIARTFLDGRIGCWRGSDGIVRPAPMHGLLRAAVFRTDVIEPARLRMSAVWEEDMAEAFPFPFVFSVEYALEGNALEVSFTVENTGQADLPFSVGNHFYFAVPAAERARWMLECPCRGYARQAPDGKIVAVAAPAGGGCLADPGLSDLFHLGPAGPGVVLRHADDGRRLVFALPADAAGAAEWYAVTTWTESPASDFYCVEPWSALPDAVHSGRGLRWLKPGSRETLRLRLTAEGW